MTIWTCDGLGAGEQNSLMKLSPRPWHMTLSPGSVKRYLNCETLGWYWRAIQCKKAPPHRWCPKRQQWDGKRLRVKEGKR